MSTETQTPIGTAHYNGKPYAILWAGTTKFGEKLKLAFPDNLKEQFWIHRNKAQRVQIDDDNAAWREHQPRRESPARTQSRSAANKTSSGAGPQAQAPGPADIDEPPIPEPDECFCSSCGQLIPQDPF